MESNLTAAEFRERTRCIACCASTLRVLDRGKFGREPHLSWIEESPWGTSPLPYLRDSEWVLVQCENCSQVFHQRTLTEDWDERRFQDWMTDDAIRRFEESRGHHLPAAKFERARRDVEHLLKLERLTRELRASDPLRLLDFGCGWGRFLGVAKLFGCEVSGIDRSTARREGTDADTTIFESFEDLRASGRPPVHVASMFQVLEHLFEPLEVLKALHGFVVPNGLLVLEVPDASKITALASRDDLIVDGIDHINAFTPGTLERIAREAGFESINPSVAHVTADFHRVVKREGRRIADRVGKRTTNQYFRRV